MKFAIARVSAFIFAGLCVVDAATVRDPVTASLTANATKAEATYCLARPRGFNPEHQPQAYLVLRLRVAVSFSNEGTRPLIVPQERHRFIYTGLKQEELHLFKERLGMLDPAWKVMKELPPDVGRDSPVSPKNDIFAVIAAGDQMTPIEEEITLPVNRSGVFRTYPDLRGHRVYIELRYQYRDLSDNLKADLADRWSRFGTPWTGTLATNTIAVDVPASPQAAACVDIETPAHPVVGNHDNK